MSWQQRRIIKMGEASDLKGETEKRLWQEFFGGFDYQLRALSFGVMQRPADSTQNPSNNFLKIPRYGTELHLRPDASLSFRDLYIGVKPRLELSWQRWEDGESKGETESDDDCYINEWLSRLKITDHLFVSYGRENLQWGPSYLLSLSNPFFRDNGRRKPKLEVPGMDFARLVWLLGAEWTLSFIANMDEGRQEFVYYEFEKTYALKLDYNGQQGYSSLILSHQESDRTRLGCFWGMDCL